MKEIKVNELTDNLFETISKEWMLVTAGTKDLYLYPPRALYIRLYRAE